MSWITAGIAAAGAIKGGMDAESNRKQQKKNDKFRKAAIQYSPWTGMGDPGMQSAGNTDTFSGALGGGLQGASLGMGAQQSGMFGGATAAPAAGGNAVGMVSPQMQQPPQNTWSTMKQPSPQMYA